MSPEDETVAKWTHKSVQRGFGVANSTLAWSGCTYTQQGDVLLNNVFGYVKPGEMLCVIGGVDESTALLQMVTRRRQTANSAKDGSTSISGQLLFNGRVPDSQFNRAVAFIPKTDIHLPTLTVRETLQFSADIRNPMGMPEQEITENVETVMELLNMTHTQDTNVGNQSIRGISGGEKKRLSIGVELVAGHSIIVADQPTNGLDSKTAFSVCSAAKAMCLAGKSFVSSVVQASPELLRLFDNVMILSKGNCLYFGSVSNVEKYFNQRGFTRPDVFSLPEFLEQLAAAPEKFYDGSVPLGALSRRQVAMDRTSFMAYTMDVDPDSVFKHLLKSFVYSSEYELLGKTMWSDFVSPLATLDEASGRDFIKRHHPRAVQYDTIGETDDSFLLDKGRSKDMRDDEFEHGFARSSSAQFSLLVKRQLKVALRNPDLTVSRMMAALVNSLVMGSLFYNLDNSQSGASGRFSVIFFIVASNAFASLPSIPILLEQRDVFYRQHAGGYFNVPMFYLCHILVELLYTTVEVVISTMPAYAMAGLKGGIGSPEYLLTFLVVMAVRFTSWAFCQMISVGSPNVVAATALGPMLLNIWFVFGGFFIPRDSIPGGWIWMYFISFFSFATRALCINEFDDSTFECTVEDNPCFTTGKEFMDVFDINTDESGRWLYILIPWGFWLVFNLIGYLFLANINYEFSVSKPKVKEPKKKMHERNVAVEMRGNAGETSNAVYLSFQDLKYTVQVHKKDSKFGTQDKVLLKSISGFIKPGKLLALMGASGAGKSTLLDVLADRKTSGSVEGELLINGEPRDDQFHRFTGYVEQFDSLCPQHTVFEAIVFSAKLRLGKVLGKAELREKVDRVIDQLGLREVAHFVIGTPEIGGISPLMRKKTSIAVELVTEPALLFLDEPTTGLDSQSASAVVHTIRSLVAQDRAIICTIHQPSQEIFKSFDEMLLLARGEVVYFGPINDMSSYFNANGFGQCPEEKNPADYALEISGLSEGPASGESASVWKDSDESQAVMQELSRGVAPSNVRKLAFETRYATGVFRRVKLVCLREFRRKWRMKAQLMTTFVFMPLIMGLVLGSVFWQMGDTTEDARNRLSFIYTCILFLIFQGVQEVAIFIQDREMYFREKTSGHYSMITFYTGRLIAQQPFLILAVLMFSAPTYLLAGLNNSSFMYFMSMFGAFQASNAIAITTGIVAPNPETGTSSMVGIMVIFSIFSGFIVPKHLIPDGWIWMFYGNFVSWAFFMAGANEFQGSKLMAADGTVYDGEVWASTAYSITGDDEWIYFAWLMACCVALHLLAIFSLAFKKPVKR